MKITEKEKKVVKDFKKYYKKVRRCKNCGTFYGTDMKMDNFLCPICDKEFKKREKERK